ncbi:MAG: RNA polymerase factor sigma-54 [Deltaproteobacteria bacterium]|nr:RNA polymerase factor sigma-54 [Deltaproteobacteria bacterium]
MAYELKQEQRLTQSLVMTPQLQLAIKLLQLSTLELVEMVKEEMQENPVLEDTAADGMPPEAAVPEPQPATPEKAEVDWEAYIESRIEGQSEFGVRRLDFNAPDDDDEGMMGNVASAAGGLREHLLWQMSMQRLSSDDLRLCEFIIGNIAEDGYLRLIERTDMNDGLFEAAVAGEITRLTGASAADVERILAVVRQSDPVGAGSRTLRECMLTQARLLPVRDTVVEEIIVSQLDELGRKKYKNIARHLGVSVETVFDAARTISKCLNPTPGAGFGLSDARSVVPDVYIHKVGDDYVISLNEDGMPKLRISRYYRELLKDGGKNSPETKAYLQEKLKSAFWLIKSVHQRQRTIYRVVECIVRIQRDFLDKGLRHLKPLVLKDVAAELGVHESTVSRVTSNKYVQTPRGIFELKYFFSNAMSSTEGADVTGEYIKQKVKDIIDSEDIKNPLSDQEIIERLKSSGITLARRTATKYREALGYLSSSRRKSHF